MQFTFTFHQDPGHGWIEVPDLVLLTFGVKGKISSYSYKHGNVAYLEEDQDAGVLLEAIEAAGHTYKLIDKYTERTPIRSYGSYA
jgi:hypothetical protein